MVRVLFGRLLLMWLTLRPHQGHVANEVETEQ